MFVAGRYTSRTMSATFDTERHHVMASLLPAYGDLLIRSTGCAPFAARSCRYASTFARYCAVEALHGVGIPAPKSSFSTMSGVAHPSVRSTALPYCASAAASIVEGSAGALGVPTLRGIFRSKAYVAAPRARTAAAHLVPPAPDCVVAASKVPGFARMGSSDGQPYSAHTVCCALMPHCPAKTGLEAARPAANRQTATAATTTRAIFPTTAPCVPKRAALRRPP